MSNNIHKPTKQGEEKMTFADGLKPVVSRDGSVPRTSLNINLSLPFRKVGSGEPKSLLCDMLRGTSPEELTTSLSGGGRYDYESISSLQSANTEFGCKDCGCEEWKSLQVQYQLSHNMDTKIQEEAPLWEGERSAK
jgi:hypothetical protein